MRLAFPNSSPRRRQRTALGLLTGLLALVAAAPAAASTLAMDASGNVRFSAAAGEVNAVRATDTKPGTAGMVVTDPGSVVTARAGCRVVTAHEASCPFDPNSDPTLRIDLRDGDDSATAFKSLGGTIEIYGGTGDDAISDAPRDVAVVDGGSGDDDISAFTNFGGVDVHGGGGNDHISSGQAVGLVAGDAGDDRIDLIAFFDRPFGGARSLVTGGAGDDTITASEDSGFETADAGSGSDTVVTESYSYIAHIIGGGGADTIRESADAQAPSFIETGRGRDTVDGGGGGDTIDCGAAADRYVVYAGDTVTGCELPFMLGFPDMWRLAGG